MGRGLHGGAEYRLARPDERARAVDHHRAIGEQLAEGVIVADACNLNGNVEIDLLRQVVELLAAPAGDYEVGTGIGEAR